MTTNVIPIADRRRAPRATADRRARREADNLRALILDLEQQVIFERKARIRMECLAQRKGAAGHEIEAARSGGAA